MVVASGLFLVHTDDQVFVSLDGAKNAVKGWSSGRDSNATCGK